jgi:hypothetical protein
VKSGNILPITNRKQRIMKHAIIIITALVIAATLSGQNSMTITYSDGDLPTDRQTNWVGPSTCPGTMTAQIPEGHMITGIDLTYAITALNWGWMSDQRSKLISPTLDAGENNYFSGSGSGGGTVHYNRTGLSFANFATGEIVFELHAGRTFGSSWGCNTNDQKVDNNSWQMTIYHEPIPPCPKPYHLEIVALDNTSATISWTQMGTTDSWLIVYGNSGFDPETSGTQITGIDAIPHTIDGLSPFTDYDLYVKADCGTEGLSVWSELLGFQTNANPITGTFTINQNEPTAGTNFASFADLATIINSGGLAGPVVVEIVEGTGPYVEQVILGAFPNSSETNTLSINGNGETLEFTSTNAQQQATLKMDGTSHLQVNNLVIKALGTTTGMDFQYGFGVHLLNNANHIIFDNCHFVADKTASSVHEYIAFLASNSHTSVYEQGLAASNIIVQNSIIEGGYFGMRFNGPANAPFAENNQISNCVFVDFRNTGMHVSGHHDMIIDGNTFSRPTRAHFANITMIFFSGQMGGAQITNNIIGQFHYASSTSSAHGIHGSVFSAGSDKPMLIANNHVAGFNNMNANTYGISLTTSNNNGYVNVYHNTVLMHNPNYTGSGFVYCFYHSGDNAVLNIKNNIFSYTSNSTGWKSNMFFSRSSTTLSSNNNVLHQGASIETNRYVANWTNAHNYTSLSDWQYARGHDLASLDNDPLFSNPDLGNLVPVNGIISKIGTDLSSIVSHDITGQLRTNPPDPGAYEFEPSLCPLPSQLSVSNVGLDHATVSWAPNGNEEFWQISYGLAGFDPDEGTIVSGIDDIPYLLQGLDHSAAYQLYVQADCGEELTSAWAGPVSFTTLCGSVALPYVQNFDDLTRPNLPICWEKVVNSTSNNALISTTATFNQPHSPPNHVRIFNSWDPNAELLLISPAFDEDMEDKNLFFWAVSDHPMAQLEVGTVSDDDVFTPHHVIDIAMEYSYHHITLGAAAAGQNRIGFRHGVTATFQSIYLDDVTVAGAGYAGSLSGTVSNLDGQSVSDARVFNPAFETFTDANGNYEVNNLLPGNYDITIEKGGFAIQTITTSVQSGEQTTNNMAFTYGSKEFPLSFTPRSTIMMPTGSFFYNSTATNGTHLYMSTDDGRLHTYDMADTENPALVNSIAVDNIEALFFHDYLFAGNGSNILVYSLANPTVPVLVQTLGVGGNLKDMHFNGIYAYCLIHQSEHNSLLKVFDLSGQGGVVELANIAVGGGASSYMLYIPERELLYIHGLSRWESYTMSIADVSDPDNPTLTWSSVLPYTNSRMAAYPSHIILANNANNNGTMMAYGTHNPAAPELLKEQVLFENHFVNEISSLDGTLMVFVRNTAEITSLTTVVYDENDNLFYRGSTLREGLFMPVSRFNFHQLDGGRLTNPPTIYWSQSTGVSFLKSSSYSDRYRDYEIEKDEEDCIPGSLTIIIMPDEAAADGCSTSPAAGVTHHYPCTPVAEGLLATPAGDWSFKKWHGAPPGNPSQIIIDGHESVAAEFVKAELIVSDQMAKREYCVDFIAEHRQISASTSSFTALGDDWILSGFKIEPYGTGHDALDIDTVLVYAPGPIYTKFTGDNSSLQITCTPPIYIE